MKKIVSGYVKFPLILRIAIGLSIGLTIGLLARLIQGEEVTGGITFIGVFGEVFVGALKAIAPLLVFVLHRRTL